MFQECFHEHISHKCNLRIGSYTVTFNANGGNVNPTVGTTGIDAKLSSLPTPTREGYIFTGWFTAETGGTEVTLNTVFDSDSTVYAQWSPQTIHIVKFHANGGTVSPDSSHTLADSTLASYPEPTREGHAFEGWFTSATGGTKINADRKYDSHTTIYAQWTELSPIVQPNFAAGNIRLITTANHIQIVNLNRDSVLRLYDLRGKALITRMVQPSESVSITHLPKGVYMVNIGGQTLKFVK